LGYTGFYQEVAVHLDLTQYRAYDTDKARWLSRDPMFEKAGINLYEYVNDSPLDGVDPDGLKVQLCCRNIQVNWFLNGIARIFNLKHCWIKTDTTEAGMGPAGSGALPACPFGVQTAIVDHSGESSQPGTKCTDIPDEDEKCVNDSLNMGQSTGAWGPFNNCNTFANGILKKCKKTCKNK
jgi:RHS repeat-associated protein